MGECFDPYAPKSEARYDAMASIRAADGVMATSAGYYLATASAVEAGLRDVERFVGSFIDTAGLAEEDTPISAIPEPRHGPIRRVINTVVAGHRTAQAEPFICELAGRLVDEALAASAFGLASANRDEARYEEPAEFRMDRPRPGDHLAFGTGPHVCPGASLARLETVVVLETLCDRVAEFGLADGFVPVPNPVFWALGHRSLEVTVTSQRG